MHPFRKMKYLHVNRDENKNKVMLVLYLVNFLFIFVDLVYLRFYIVTKSVMLYVNIFWLLVNINSFRLLEKEKTDVFTKIMFIEPYIYMVLAVLLLGWSYGFQLYIYGMVCCFFLPFYLPDTKARKRNSQIWVASIFILTYYILHYVKMKYNLNNVVGGSEGYISFIYGLNSLISIFGILVFSVLSSRIALESKRRLSRRADYDELTGIYNRYSLNTIINSHINVKELNTFNVALLDIDFFKKVNDTYGHNAGDEVLKIVAKKLNDIQDSDIDVGRWGGEEFLIVSKDGVSYNEFKKILESVRKYFEKNTFDISKNKISITVSIGLTMYKSGDDIKSLVKKADDNLYVAKSSGRNKIIG